MLGSRDEMPSKLKAARAKLPRAGIGQPNELAFYPGKILVNSGGTIAR